jgi:hypothetical protein
MFMIRRVLMLSAVLAATVLFATPASANGAGAVSFTQTFHNTIQTFTPPDPMATNPCTGAPGTLTFIYNGVFHMTMLTSGVGAGTGWGTFTAAGDATLVQTGVTYSGHFATWDGFNFNLNNYTATATFSGHLTGSDGTSLAFHGLFHITALRTTPPTVIVTFNRLNCG